MTPGDYTKTAQEAAETFRPYIEDKNILITGVSTKSLGAETVRVLGPYVKTIIIASRSTSRSEEAIAPLRESSKAEFKLVAMDLSSLRSVESAAKEINSFGIPIHVAINNAAIRWPSTLTSTEDGFEAALGSNHLGHMYLISLILPSLKLAAKDGYHPRVVALSSLANVWATIRDDDPNFKLRPDEWGVMGAYGNSKLAIILFAREFAKRYKAEGLLAYSVHPGTIRTTNAGSDVPDQVFVDVGWITPNGSVTEKGREELKNVEQGAASTVIAAFDPQLEEYSGAYIRNNVIETSPDQVSRLVTDENALKIWEMSERLLKRKFEA